MKDLKHGERLDEKSIASDSILTIAYKDCAVDTPNKNILKGITEFKKIANQDRLDAEKSYDLEKRSFDNIKFEAERVGGYANLKDSIRQELCDIVASLVVWEHVLLNKPIPVTNVREPLHLVDGDKTEH